MSELAGLPLAELRARARRLRQPAALARLARALQRDPRRGARDLGRGLERQLLRRRREARRLAGLFARARRLRARGLLHVAGVDEVGVGPLAGPLVAAAVVLPARVDLPGLNDSKQLRRSDRERLAAAIRSQALDWAVAEVAPGEVDRLNVYRAGLEAMRRAVAALRIELHHVLVDARSIPGIPTPQTPLVGGDASEGCIAAASIVAKVHRDDRMREAHRHHPDYGFDRHMGYATRAHLRALRRLGPTELHRRSTQPVSQLSLL